MYNYKYNEILGIDLKADSIHVVHVVKKVTGPKVLGKEWARLPENEEEQHKVIKAFLKANHWQNMPCVVSSYHNASLLRTIEIQDGSAKAISFGLKKLESEFSIVSNGLSILDYQVVTIKKRKLLVAIAGRLVHINNFLTFLKELNLAVVDIVHLSVGVLSGLESVAKQDEFLLTVNASLFGTDIIMGKNASPLYFYHSSISSSGYSRENLNNPLEESTIVFPKQLSLIETGRFNKGGLNTIWQSEVNASIGKAINFSAKHNITLKKVSLAFENSAQTFSDTIIEKTGLKVDNISLEELELETRFLSAFGLATLAILEKPHMSLLPEIRRQKKILKFNRKAFFLAPLLIILTEILIICLLKGGISELSQQKGELALHLQKEQALVLEIKSLRQENIMYHIQEKPFKNAIRNNHSLLRTLEAVSKAKSSDDWITVIADKEKYSTPAKSQSSKTQFTSTKKIQSFVIEGYTLKDDLTTVKEMIAKLKTDIYIYDADLIGDNVRRDYIPLNLWTNQQYKLFAVELKLQRYEY